MYASHLRGLRVAPLLVALAIEEHFAADWALPWIEAEARKNVLLNHAVPLYAAQFDGATRTMDGNIVYTESGPKTECQSALPVFLRARISMEQTAIARGIDMRTF